MAKPYKPLWADPPPDEPDPYADVTARWTVEHDDEPEPQPESPGGERPRRRFRALTVVAPLAAVALVALVAPGGSLTVDTVPSAWGDIDMRCETVRVEKGERAFEAFRCRATRGEDLPPGRYATPESNWTSDLTRQPARYATMEITPDGVLRGVAAYGAD